jgi:hypothetical protein
MRDGITRGTAPVAPEFATRGLTGTRQWRTRTAVRSGASDSPRTTICLPEQSNLGPRGDGRSVNSSGTGSASRCDRLADRTVGKQACVLVSTSVGVVRIDGGGRAVSAGVKAAGPSSYRFPPPDSGVVPFSEEPFSPIKSDLSASGRVGCRSGASSRFHRPRFRKGSNPSTWGRNGNR